MKFLIILLFINNVYASNLDDKLRVMNIPKGRINIIKLQKAIKACKVDSNLLLGIIRVESAFHVDAYNKHSNDFGLMQINNWHVRRKKLKKALLLSSISYNIYQGCIILKWFLKTYKVKEAIGRYNCGTKKGCVKWKANRRYVRRVLYYKKLIGGI